MSAKKLERVLLDSETQHVDMKEKSVEIHQAVMSVNVRNISKEQIVGTQHQNVSKQCVHRDNLERPGIDERPYVPRMVLVSTDGSVNRR